MRKILKMLAVVALSTVSISGFTQTNSGKISGMVKDGNEKTIEAATISLVKALDSSVVKVSVADKAGNYLFENVGDGKYFVTISAVGHEKGFSETFDINGADGAIKLKTIELMPAAKAIGGVVVSSKKPLIEQKIDRMVVNVEAAVTNIGASALEVLEKSPGI
ncbi:MAG TPA: carboxypeptidase-like regulatory domain-containing protein, partial [Chitinophagaceae bacterium]